MKRQICRGFFRSRRGVTVETLGSYALAFGVAVIITAVVAQMLGQIYTVQASCSSGVTDDYSFDPITFTTNNTEYGARYSPLCSGTLYLGSNSTYPIPSAKYAVSSTGYTLYANGTLVCWPNITAGCTYYASYNFRVAEIENITTKGLIGSKTMGDWFPTIATIIAAVLVITLIIVSFKGQITGGFEGF